MAAGKAERRSTLRWAINISTWNPSTSEWNFLLSLLPQDEREKIHRFKRTDDRIRALTSRIMQRCACEHALGVRVEDAQLMRTKGSKPFLANLPNPRPPGIPNFNFNVSHEGSFVALAAEPVCICGVDVAAPYQLRPGSKETLEDAMQRVMKYFTQSEREQVESWSSETDRENAFRRQWSMKEAFVKARGDGLGFQLNRAEFHLDSEDSEKSSDFDDDDDDEEDDAGNDEDGETAPSGTDTNDEDEEATLQLRRVSLQRKNSNSLSKLASANGVNNGTSNGGGGLKRTSSTHSVVQDGENRPSWALRTQPLGDSHIVSVATGPPQDVVDAHGVFKSTLTQLDDDKPAEEWREQYLSYDRPPFELVTIADVMPPRLRRKYEETGGEVL